jgi:hypothetical protein
LTVNDYVDYQIIAAELIEAVGWLILRLMTAVAIQGMKDAWWFGSNRWWNGRVIG